MRASSLLHHQLQLLHQRAHDRDLIAQDLAAGELKVACIDARVDNRYNLIARGISGRIAVGIAVECGCVNARPHHTKGGLLVLVAGVGNSVQCDGRNLRLPRKRSDLTLRRRRAEPVDDRELLAHRKPSDD